MIPSYVKVIVQISFLTSLTLNEGKLYEEKEAIM